MLVIKIFFNLGLIFLLKVFFFVGRRLIILKVLWRINDISFLFFSFFRRVGKSFFFMIDFGKFGRILISFFRNCCFLLGVLVGKFLRKWMVEMRMLLKYLFFWNFFVVMCWVGWCVSSLGSICWLSFLGNGWEDR